MPEARVELPDGSRVTVTGTEEEVRRIMRLLTQRKGRDGPRATSEAVARTDSRPGGAVTDYVIELRDAGQFDKPKGLTDVREALASEGHIVPITTLSGVMLGLARSKQLRRFKENGVWKYVKR